MQDYVQTPSVLGRPELDSGLRGGRDGLVVHGRIWVMSVPGAAEYSPVSAHETACAVCVRGITLQKQLIAPWFLEAERNSAALKEIIKA